MQHRSYGGTILHIHDSGREIGRETFTITVHTDQRTVRAVCELEGEEVLRDVTYTVDGDWSPVDAFVRLTIKDRFQGSGWFRFDDEGAACETFTADAGRLSQRVTLGHRPTVFVPHPLVTDGWQTGTFDHAKADRVQRIDGGAHSSPHAHGGSGPMIGVSSKRFEYVGEERLTVPAGTFDTRHYRLLSNRPDWSPLELWVFGPDRQLAKAHWDLRERDYILTDLWGDIGR
ncbi:MAG: hypothetical protein EXQ85_02895 [Alphaproteobacteria bacterium]|nr:hypothetical protein [Alphaproteobacteria bacterium]